jgi:hypothetical protein
MAVILDALKYHDHDDAWKNGERKGREKKGNLSKRFIFSLYRW